METTSPAWLPAMTRMVMAGDEASREWADEEFACGTSWQQAVWYVGSFSRIAWLRDLEKAGEISRFELYAEWLELWCGSGPHDTHPSALEVWQEAKVWAGGIVTDAPDGLTAGTLTVYRGQHAGEPLGISWTLDLEVAV